MRKYLKSYYHADMYAYRTGDDSLVDAVDAVNIPILSDIINGLFSGKYSYAYIERGQNQYVITRSTRFADKLQVTTICNGTPESHRDIATVKDIWGCIPFGNYINISV